MGGADVAAAGMEGFAGLVADQGREGGVAALVPVGRGDRGGGGRAGEPKCTKESTYTGAVSQYSDGDLIPMALRR